MDQADESFESFDWTSISMSWELESFGRIAEFTTVGWLCALKTLGSG
jgi:hypothetical protein